MHPDSSARPHWEAQLGDARRGKFAQNLMAFARALRRAGIPVDPARIALAQQALMALGPSNRKDVSAALECVLICRHQDVDLFREMFDLFFRDPELAHQLLARMIPRPPRPAKDKPRPRVLAALSPAAHHAASSEPPIVELDGAMTASALQRLREADFNQLSAREYQQIQHLVRDIPLRIPTTASRRYRHAATGSQPHWRKIVQCAARHGGEPARLYHRRRRREPLPLLVLLDVSGSMERYARTLLAFLHAATQRTVLHGRPCWLTRHTFAFGTNLTDLSAIFRLTDTDQMLMQAAQRLKGFAGGTRLASSLTTLRREHAHRLVGRRTLVLLITDGLDTDDPQHLDDELRWLKRHARRLLWLNPLLRFDGYTPSARGAAVLHAHADAMLAVHNVARLQALASALAALAKQ